MGEVDFAKPIDAILQERRVSFRRQLRWAGEKLSGCRGVDVYLSIALDIQQAFYVEHVQNIVPAECDGARVLALRNAVVEKFEMHLFIAALHPGEEQMRNSAVGLHRARQRVMDGFVATHRQPGVPGAFAQGARRNDYTKQKEDLAESRQQVAARLVGGRGKTVEPEPVDQQMRYATQLRLAGHVAVELLIDDA